MPDVILPPTIPDATPSSYPELTPEPRGSWLAENRKSAILGGIVVLLAGVIGLTTWWQNRVPQTSNTNSVSNSAVNSDTNTPGTTSTTNRPTFRRYQATITPDQDEDGLADSEETQAGTKLDLADTDSDGLSDYDEVKIYQTKPLKADTDGDGQSDGQEVRAGNNPNGPGPLLNLNQAIQQLNKTN